MYVPHLPRIIITKMSSISMPTYQSQSKENGGIIIIPSGALYYHILPNPNYRVDLTLWIKGVSRIPMWCRLFSLHIFKGGIHKQCEQSSGGSKSPHLYYNREKNRPQRGRRDQKSKKISTYHGLCIPPRHTKYKMCMSER